MTTLSANVWEVLSKMSLKEMSHIVLWVTGFLSGGITVYLFEHNPYAKQRRKDDKKVSSKPK